MSYANNKGVDQPAHLHNLIRPFIVRCTKQRLLQTSEGEQFGFSVTWLHTSKDRFSHNLAQLNSS